MEAAWLDAATSQDPVQTALWLSAAAALCAAALGVPWFALHARAPVLDWVRTRVSLVLRRPREAGATGNAALPELQRVQPLALTFPALLVSLSYDAAFLSNLGRLAPAPLTPWAQVVTLLYLTAAALLYYRPLRGAWSWIWAAALCTAPVLMAAQAARLAGGWSGGGGPGESVVRTVVTCGLCLAAWWAALLMHRPAPGGGAQGVEVRDAVAQGIGAQGSQGEAEASA